MIDESKGIFVVTLNKNIWKTKDSTTIDYLSIKIKVRIDMRKMYVRYYENTYWSGFCCCGQIMKIFESTENLSQDSGKVNTDDDALDEYLEHICQVVF